MFGPTSQLALFPADAALRPPAADAEARLDLTVRKSGRAKRLSIKVYPRGKVEVVVPKRTGAKEVASFVEENKAWIARARNSFAQEFPPEDIAPPQSIRFPSTGKTVAVTYRHDANGHGVRYRTGHGRVVLTGRVHDDEESVRALKRWLSETARREFAPWLAALSQLTGMPFSKMHIRAQKTCWGSRSSSGTISLNLCLLFLEPSLVRYLMIHELCHGRHMNHSKRFWRLVGTFEPDYRRLDRDLGESWREVPAWLGIY